MSGARILVVDDEPAIRLLCRVNLQADGFAVAERIRDDPALAGTRVMFLTARADIGDNDRARGTGAVGHVTKPFNPSSLGDEVRAALAR